MGSFSMAESTLHHQIQPARASMSTGTYPEVHGNAAYYFDEEPTRLRPDPVSGRRNHLPALADEADNAAVQWYMDRIAASPGRPEHPVRRACALFKQRCDAAIRYPNLRP